MNDFESDLKTSIKLVNVGSFGDRPCGCKGIRTCLLCESYVLQRSGSIKDEQSSTIIYIFCPKCESKAWLNDDHNQHLEGSNLIHYEGENVPQFIQIKGITLIQNVIDKDEEKLIVSLIDDPSTPSPWVSSQSGRRKQDYGPKVNFRKKKVKVTDFRGLPDYGHELFHKLSTCTKVLENFIPVELCNLEYVPERGSSIDPHLDDDWLWGERLVTVNLLSETRLTLSPVTSSQEKDNQLGQGGHRKTEIEIRLNNRSLLVLYGEARYEWYHAIKRDHITERRIGITIRELTPLFLPEGELYPSVGEKILSIAGHSLSCNPPAN